MKHKSSILAGIVAASVGAIIVPGVGGAGLLYRSQASKPPTVAVAKHVLEVSLKVAYQDHFYGVKNRVVFKWIGPVKIGQPDMRLQPARMCFPAKLRVKVTVTDPRDGNTMTLERGTNANIAGYSKIEIFCFFRDGFGDWDYGTYDM